MRKLLLTLLVILPVQIGICNVPADADGKDDSEVIVLRIRESLNKGGLISIEQHTGRLLFNPIIDRLQTMTLKKKFLMPAMIVEQSHGLKLVQELPFSCFLIVGGELASDEYAGYRQHETLRYIRDVKNFPVSRALICETMGATAKVWSKVLDLAKDSDTFIFDEHVSLKGEHFFYYLNTDGSFEMYM